MNIPERCILDVLYKLNNELTCPKLPMACEDPREWAWQVKDTNIQFVVAVEDEFFRVKVYKGKLPEEEIEGPEMFQTDDPQKVIQAAKAFKSKYLHDK